MTPAKAFAALLAAVPAADRERVLDVLRALAGPA